MAKLFIKYRTKDNDNYFKGKTYFTFQLKDKITEISIAPNETEKLATILSGIEKQLQDGYHLEKDEKFEISEFDKQIIETEKHIGHRVDAETYNLCKMGYEAVISGKTTFEKLIKIIESEVNA